MKFEHETDFSKSHVSRVAEDIKIMPLDSLQSDLLRVFGLSSLTANSKDDKFTRIVTASML